MRDRRQFSLRGLLPGVIQWLAPAECLLCRETHNDRGFLCADCQRALPRNEHACQRCATPMPHSTPHIPGAPRRYHCPACHTHPTTCKRILAPFLMQGTFRELLHLWKFQNHPQLSPLMARLFASTAAVQAQPQPTQQNLGERRILVPIPTQWHRQLRRGFDHTWLLAQALRPVLGEKPGSGRGCATRSCGGRSTDPIEPIAGSTMPVVSSLRQALRANTLRWSMM